MTMKTRKQQIAEAAEAYEPNGPFYKTRDAFKEGAKWADANPKQTTNEVLEHTNISISLAIAVEALRKIEGPDKTPRDVELFDWMNAWRNTTKIMAREALEKIEGEK